ncbi:MAG TPA: glutamate mutase L [Ktedonobacterales bacterium]|nr:glutamate mutase L [Ktedonobacterales bacterium]
MAVPVQRGPQSGEETDAQAPAVVRSLLLVDCGSVHTKVALLARIDGQMRLLARAQSPTTLLPPIEDLRVGVYEAIATIERITGRALLREGQIITPEQPDATGVDTVALTANAGGPLRILATGPGREALTGLLHRAIGGLFAQVEPLPTIRTHPAPSAAEWQQALAQARAFQPHALLIVGPPFSEGKTPSMDETATQMGTWLDGLAGAAAARPSARNTLPVVFTGSPSDAETLTLTLRDRTFVHEVAGLSPSTLAPLNRAVSALYETVVLRSLPSFAVLRQAAATPPIAPITALAGMMRYLAQRFRTNVLGVDIGASSTTLMGATANGDFLPAVHPLAGVGPGLGAILRERGAASVLRWLSFQAAENELREYALMRMLRRTALPATARELEFEHAFAREVLALAMRAPGSRLPGLHPLDVILGSGGVLANAPHPAMAALILLDALQPVGITSMVLDSAQLAGALGGVAALDPAAAGEVAALDAVVPQLATVISLTGEIQVGQPAVRVSLEDTSGSRTVAEVMGGTLAYLPLAPGAQATLGLYPVTGVDAGLGPGQHAQASEAVEGGTLGVIVDARGRPLRLPDDDEERQRGLRAWRQALGLDG